MNKIDFELEGTLKEPRLKSPPRLFFCSLFLLLRILYERSNHIDSGVHLHLHSILLYNYATIYEFSVDGYGGRVYKTKHYAMNTAAHVFHYYMIKNSV